MSPIGMIQQTYKKNMDEINNNNYRRITKYIKKYPQIWTNINSMNKYEQIYTNINKDTQR